MLLGYARVSTTDQNEDRQIKLLLENGVEEENIFIEKLTGKNMDRPKLKSMLIFCRKGDTVITESISRIARNTKDFLTIIEKLNNKNVNFISLKENIDTSTPAGKFMLTVFAALSELERENILQRQREGIAIAKEQGKYKGRKKIEIDRTEFEKVAKQWRNGDITAMQAMRKLNIKGNTFYRRIQEWKL